MALLTIPGMTEESILNASTEPQGGGLRPFPCDGNGSTRHTAVVMEARHETGTNTDGSAKDQILLLVANGQYGGRIYQDLITTNVPPGTKDVEKRQQQNLQTLLNLVKVLGCHTQGRLDTGKLPQAVGKEIEISAKHAGFDQKDGRYFHKVRLYYNGACKEWREVIDTGLPPLPGATGQAAMPQGQQQSFDDIPF